MGFNLPPQHLCNDIFLADSEWGLGLGLGWETNILRAFQLEVFPDIIYLNIQQKQGRRLWRRG
jgi:hypothetical protein